MIGCNTADDKGGGLSVLPPPYTRLLPIRPEETIPTRNDVARGVALIWQMDQRCDEGCLHAILTRPGGVPVILILPPSAHLDRVRRVVLQVIEEGFPHGVLPFHPSIRVSELEALLRAMPDGLGREALEYMEWRGVAIDRDTRTLLERMAILARDTSTLRGVCSKLYLSRRALGRRLNREGLPVPSHWLQFFRLLHVLAKLQEGRVGAHLAARELGYPDGFTLSNQMNRLVGVRPSLVKKRLGWEWFVEAWLQKEMGCGRLHMPSYRG